MYVAPFIRPGAGHVAVGVTGDLDLSSGPWLREYLLRMLGIGWTRLSVDLSGVTFIDCCALRALLGTCRDAARCGGSVRFTALSPRVRRLAQLTGQHDAIPMAALPARMSGTGAPW
jgi:anti-sigma B factor antagonist